MKYNAVVFVSLTEAERIRLEEAARLLGMSRVEAARRFVHDGTAQVIGGLGP